VVAIIAVNSMWLPASAAEDNRTLIFVVDSSERMAPYLSGVKGVILTYADQSTPGDYLGIISCSKTAKLLTMKKISGPGDKKVVGTMLEALDASDDTANVQLGVARAFEEIRMLRRRGDDNLKGVIIISAPRPTGAEPTEEKLEEASREISKSVSKDEWYIQYCYLNGVLDDRIEAFISANEGLSYDVDALKSEHGTETIAELYRIVSMPEERCLVSVFDLNGPLLMKVAEGEEWVPAKLRASIREGTHLKASVESRAVIKLSNYGKIGLAPMAEFSLISARRDPLAGRAIFHLALGGGSVWIFLGEKSGSELKIDSQTTTAVLAGETALAGEAGGVSVASFCDSLSVNTPYRGDQPIVLARYESTLLVPGQAPQDPERVPITLRQKWNFWSQSLISGASLASIDFSVPRVALTTKKIALWPIKSGQVQGWTFPVHVADIKDVSRLKMTVDVMLALPDGLWVSSGIMDGDDQYAKMLSLKLDGSSGFRSGRTETYKGLLKILPERGSQVVFEELSVPLTVVTKGPLVNPTIALIVITLVVVAAGVIGAMLVLEKRKSARPRLHRVIGRLIVINDPTKGRVGTINLEDVSRKASRLSLVIGRNRTAEVRLKHASVSPDHCALEAYLERGRLATYVEPIGSAKVVVNGEKITSRTRLADRAKIEVGDFTYQFEDTQFYKKVDVVYRNGRQRSGVLDAAGMDAEGFGMSPMDAVSPSERARVRFSDIRYITFHRRAADMLSGTPRPVSTSDTMRKVELMFKKGNTISGYLQREYSEGRYRFVELLPLDPNSNIDYTIVEYSAVVDKKIL
jgi:hypothetical protein